MTPKDHLDRAEELLRQAREITGPGYQLDVISIAVEAVGHALSAIAIELGAPHAATAGGVTSDQPTAGTPGR